MPLPRFPLLIAVLGCTLAACGDDGEPTGPGGPPADTAASGTVTFDFSGDRAGSFAATGAPPADTAASLYGTWAAGAISHDQEELAIVASRARTAPRVDLFFLALSGATQPGSYSIDLLGGAIAILLFDVDADATEVDASAVTYVLTSGTLVIESFDGVRTRGTFSGNAVHLEENSRRLFITNGVFDVRVEEDDFSVELAAAPAARRAAAAR